MPMWRSSSWKRASVRSASKSGYTPRNTTRALEKRLQNAEGLVRQSEPAVCPRELARLEVDLEVLEAHAHARSLALNGGAAKESAGRKSLSTSLLEA